MATRRKTFTLRLQDDIFDKIGRIATKEHRSMNSYIEFVILEHISRYEEENSRKEEITETTVDSRTRFRCAVTAGENLPRIPPLRRLKEYGILLVRNYKLGGQ